MESKFSKSTDASHQVTLESQFLYAIWRSRVARIGRAANLEVGTSLVGFGAPVELKFLTDSGQTLGTMTTEIKHNRLTTQFLIPDSVQVGEWIHYQVNLPDNGLTGQSLRIVARPPISVTNLKWSADTAKRGDVLTLSADVTNADDGEEAEITIYRCEFDSGRRKVTTIPSPVQSNRLQVQWEHQYLDPTLEILSQDELQPYGRNYEPPRYFFTVTIDEEEFGGGRESGLLEFRDWIEVQLLNCKAGDQYVLYLPDGSQRSGTFNTDGVLREDDVPPGKYFIEVTPGS